MFGGVNVSSADTGSVYALLQILADPAKAKATLDELNEKVAAAEKANAAAREEHAKAAAERAQATEDLKAASKSRVEAAQSKAEAKHLADSARQDVTRREVALAAREKALEARIKELDGREREIREREAAVDPLHVDAAEMQSKARKALEDAKALQAAAETRLQRIKAAAA